MKESKPSLQKLCVHRVSAVVPFGEGIKPQRRDERRVPVWESMGKTSNYFAGMSAEDNPSNAVFQQDSIEVEQQPELPPTQTELTQESRLMHRLNFESGPRFD